MPQHAVKQTDCFFSSSSSKPQVLGCIWTLGRKGGGEVSQQCKTAFYTVTQQTLLGHVAQTHRNRPVSRFVVQHTAYTHIHRWSGGNERSRLSMGASLHFFLSFYREGGNAGCVIEDREVHVFLSCRGFVLWVLCSCTIGLCMRCGCFGELGVPRSGVG